VPLSLGSNNTVIISSTDGTDLRRDGQAELAGMKQDICYYRPWLFCENRIVADSTWSELVTARQTALKTEIAPPVHILILLLEFVTWKPSFKNKLH